MKFIKTISVIIAMVLFYVLGASAEEKFGIGVYDGAKFEETSTNFLINQMKLNAVCYQTGESLAKVIEFYKKQPGIETVSTDEKGAMFKKDKVTITLQNPWQDMKAGSLTKTTLISIVNKGAQNSNNGATALGTSKKNEKVDASAQASQTDSDEDEVDSSDKRGDENADNTVGKSLEKTDKVVDTTNKGIDETDKIKGTINRLKGLLSK